MSIVQMKHLRLFGMRADRDELLHLLQHMGCVEISEPQELPSEPEWETLTRPDGGGLTQAREGHLAVQGALGVLKKYAPAKGGFLTRRPEVSPTELFDNTVYAASLEKAAQINQLEKDLSALYAEQSKLNSQRMTIAPWMSLDIPLDTPSTKEVALSFGTLPSQVNLEELTAQLATATELAQLTVASSDREFHYVLFFCHTSAEEDGVAVLKEHSFSLSNLRGFTGSAKEMDGKLVAQLETIAQKAAATQTAIEGFAPTRAALELCADRSDQEIAREEAKSRLLDTQSTFFLEGWLPASEEGNLKAKLSPYTCCWETEEPAEEDYHKVPVKLKNNWFTQPFNMVTEMYSLPAYGAIDPNPLMAPFFVFFYGMMMADMGYGLLMVLAALVVTKKTNPKGGTKNFLGLLFLCGISTFIFGAITGGFFGDFIPQIAGIINPNTTLTALPSLFTPVNDTLAVLIAALGIGMIQIFAGMAISMVRKCKRGEYASALKDEIAWYAVFICIAVAVLTGISAFGYAIIVILLGTQWIGGKGIGGKLLSIGGSLYNNITGYFSDILSYARLMALMLSGAVVAQVFNTLGAIPGNIVIFILISLLGNSLNFALNLLGCYVHDLRLQCLEYFNRFYQDGGRAFKPLEINTKYVDVSDNH